VRLAIKIRSKIDLYHHSHFIEHLVDVFRKSLWKRDLNYKTSSFLIRQLKNYTGFPCTDPHAIEKSKSDDTRAGTDKLRRATILTGTLR
jgi:hypothetical protein